MSGKHNAPKSAMILAAGLGLRMRPLTIKTPKPLVNVAKKPLIQFNLEALVNANINNVVVNIHHLPNKMTDYLKKFARLDIKISNEEDQLLDSGGGIKNALHLLGNSPFFILNADSFWIDGTAPNLARLSKAWDSSRMDILLMLAAGTQITGYAGNGDFVMNSNGELKRCLEKVISPFVYAGFGIINPKIFNETPNGPFSLNILFDRAIENQRLHGLRLDGEWYHVGTPDAISEAEQKIMRNKCRL
ncbi:MAG: nucleotidyltransferase family protein [Beijerinckiaceae bacterium]|nr:nucleotidyltransferase family protein [Beijerinckiaceae bacterium]